MARRDQFHIDVKIICSIVKCVVYFIEKIMQKHANVLFPFLKEIDVLKLRKARNMLS